MSLHLVDVAFLSTIKFLRDLHIPLSEDLIQVSFICLFIHGIVPTLSANPVHLGGEDPMGHRAGHPNKVEGNDTDQVV